MVETFRPNCLLDYELDYELKIRAVTSQRTVADKRKMLTILLHKERESNRSLISELVINGLDYDEEKVDIDKSLDSISDIVGDFVGSCSDFTYTRLKSRLAHVSNRVRRLPVAVEDQTKTNYVKEAFATCLTLEADLYEKANNQPGTSNPSSPLSSQPPIINVTSPVVSCSSRVPLMSDWQVKFNGEGKNLHNFLERISELAQSRKVDDKDLFTSAAELFVGDAFVWYKSIKNSVNDWQTLVSYLKRDFLHSDIEDELWDQIKHRKQRRTESVAVFIAHMQILFSRLSSTPAECTKVKHIRRNILPEYISQLALADINSVDDLVKYCRKLEEASYIKNKIHSVSELNSFQPEHHNSQGSSRNFSDNRQHNSQHFSDSRHLGNPSRNRPKNNSNSNKNNRNGSAYVNNSKNKNSRIVSHASSSTSKEGIQVTCWNCDLPNHFHDSCTLRRNIFCYKCGMKNVKSNSCPTCQKN